MWATFQEDKLTAALTRKEQEDICLFLTLWQSKLFKN